jgi:hypothetical protein
VSGVQALPDRGHKEPPKRCIIHCSCENCAAFIAADLRVLGDGLVQSLLPGGVALLQRSSRSRRAALVHLAPLPLHALQEYTIARA